MAFLFLGSKQPTWLVREACIKCDTYECAYKYIRDTSTVCPFYMSIVGTKKNEGCIIARDRRGVANIEYLHDDRWYILQTNEDHFRGICHDRCVGGHKQIYEIDREKITPEVIRDQGCMMEPLMNKWTIYTSTMSPRHDVWHTVLANSTYTVRHY